MNLLRKLKRSNDSAVSPVIAVILMVAITVVLAATVYVWVSGFSGGGSAAKTISLASNGPEDSAFERSYTIASATSGMKWQDVSFTVDGTPLYFTTNATAADGEIRAAGEAADAVINAGDQITIDLLTSGSGRTLRVLDSQANSVIYTINLG